MCHFMRQIIFIGFSTTGKSTLINKISDKFPNRAKFDTDKAIAKDFNNSIANIYYAHNEITDTHKFIEDQELAVLIQLTKADDNLIIAAGPGIPFRTTFSTYIQTKQPHVVLIERPAVEIYDSLLERRNKMKAEAKHQRADFGIWDIGVMVDDKLVDYPPLTAIKNIQSLLDQRQEPYNKFASLKINSSDIFKHSLPQSLLDIL
jgi:shikimate kinase